MQNEVKRLYRLALIFLVLLFALTGGAFWGIKTYAGTSQPVEEMTPPPTSIETDTVHSTNSVNGSERRLHIRSGESASDYMWIPLEKKIGADLVTIENHYMDRQLWVLIGTGDASFYDDAIIEGNCDRVTGGMVEQTESGTVLKFDVDGVFEYNTLFENNVLYVGFVQPRQLYDRIVVIDPAGYPKDQVTARGVGGNAEDKAVQTGAENGSEENASPLSRDMITLGIAEHLKTQLEQTDIRVYYTRLGNDPVSDEDRTYLANAVRADLFIRIEVGSNEDSKVYGTESIYNGSFFIPGFGSVELADSLERNVVTAISGKAGGLLEAEEEGCDVIYHATVPAAAIRVGYLTNSQEAILLGREDYRERIANGIYQSILDCLAIQNGENE